MIVRRRAQERVTGADGGMRMARLVRSHLRVRNAPTAQLHDQIVNEWPLVHSFVIRTAHLFLSLMADGGTYEFAPVASAR
jgi:hypothetical protein